jgi:hypothetical protein
MRTRYPDLIALDVAVSGGSAWVCLSAVAAECGARPQRARDVRDAREIPGPFPRIELPAAAPRTGYDGVLFIGPVTASPPAVTLPLKDKGPKGLQRLQGSGLFLPLQSLQSFMSFS